MVLKILNNKKGCSFLFDELIKVCLIETESHVVQAGQKLYVSKGGFQPSIHLLSAEIAVVSTRPGFVVLYLFDIRSDSVAQASLELCS